LKCWEIENQNRTHKRNPDQAWEKYALPIGNGFLGAMLYGDPARERVQLNLHSLWSGGPGAPGWTPDKNLHDAWKHLPEIRKALLAGNKKKAQALSAEYLRGVGGEGRDELDNDLKDCPTDRVRREGAGRPPVEKKVLTSSRN